MTGPEGEDWAVVNLSEWELWTGDPDARLKVAAAEIDAGPPRILESVVCGPCELAVSTTYLTSVGAVWRVRNKDGRYMVDEIGRPPAEPVACPKHGTDHLVKRKGPRSAQR